MENNDILFNYELSKECYYSDLKKNNLLKVFYLY